MNENIASDQPLAGSASAANRALPPVFVYVHDLRSSGVVRNAIVIADRLAQSFDCTLIAGSGRGFFADEARRRRFRLLVLREGEGSENAGATSNQGRFRDAAALARLLRGRRGLLISAGNFGHPVVWMAARLLPAMPRIYWMSNAIERGRRSDILRRFWARRLLADAAHVICVAEGCMPGDEAAMARAQGRLSVIPNGIDLAGAAEQSAAPVPHVWLSPEEREAVPVVMGMGRLRPQKNFPFLVDAVASLREHRRVRLVIIGGGSAEAAAALRQRAGDHGMEADFLLAGETDRVFAWLARADVFALPSRFEGAALVLREALAAGAPIVANPLAGDTREVLGDGRYGVLADITDPAEFGAALERQLGPDRVLPGSRGDAFGLDAMTDRYVELVRRQLREMSS